MKLSYVHMHGFRGYRKPIRIDFGDRFTIIDGRNGVGKSTIFDAVEFALTGTISKYGEVKAAGESVADYLWWKGKGPTPKERFVEVGFRDDDGEVSVRRTEFGKPDPEKIATLTRRLCDQALAPTSPLVQLCASSIIRDEHIASLSLDLKEADRYALLRDALGANDADIWIDRAGGLLALTKKRVDSVQVDVAAANSDMAAASRRIDEVRASLVAESTLAEAVNRLRNFAGSQAAPDRLAGPVRERMAVISEQLQAIAAIVDRWPGIQRARVQLAELLKAQEGAKEARDSASAELDAVAKRTGPVPASTLASEARSLITLIALGRDLGLRDGQCPLCAAGRSHEEFNHGIAAAEALARRLDDQAVNEAALERVKQDAEQKLAAADRNLESTSTMLTSTTSLIKSFEEQLSRSGFAADSALDTVRTREAESIQLRDLAQKDLRILETLRLNDELERVKRAESETAERLARAQERFGRAHKAQAIAQALHDATRRAASETLDRRLDRVLPLMSELYRRLRPHPVWRDIEYSIRGDVRRFLKLQVGENLNPQFLFSSGQRRATGLAFLLSVNVSLAWSRWRSILLDDPVQHVDDFRAVHLAEVSAQLVTEGRQVVCAVEDADLAELLCRRLPVTGPGEAKRVTLGPDDDGAITKLDERELTPFIKQSLVVREDFPAAG